eukprot:CAMPEP_0168186150 /NCGR_PEP_ID=MMETSP0139_2-20121125/14262_1 /TAXON_ID=44445 /ORGANISM="Pseudo-nitzschia australis, Strain 10249 10 AB" /LENGTH=319 /DNA_ID=CAMNT_0008108105 /DNA_START=145 /DNA_END=1108 /DNA_ORIENTATION=+
MPINKKSSSSSNNSNRGRFLFARAGASLRRSHNKSTKTAKPAAGGGNASPFSERGRPQLSPLKENISTTSHQHRLQHQQQHQHMKFQEQSSAPISSNETLHSTGFSQAEIHDMEESFKLFDIYGEGYVQVGDLRNILEVLKLEQQQHQNQRQSLTEVAKYPHLDTLLYRLSELSDEDTLNMDEYIQIMASTTVTNSIALEANDNYNGEEDNGNQHFARVFELFDADGIKGYITVEDLERIAIELGEHDMTRGELQEMVDRACGVSDGGGNKVVGIEEFTKMMTMSLFSPNKIVETQFREKQPCLCRHIRSLIMSQQKTK